MGDDDPFAPDDEQKENPNNEEPTKADVQASLALGDDILRQMDAQTERLKRILQVTEELKDLADHCLDELAVQKERLMAINKRLQRMDTSVEEAKGIMNKLRVNMALNRKCWVIGITGISILCVII